MKHDEYELFQEDVLPIVFFSVICGFSSVSYGIYLAHTLTCPFKKQHLQSVKQFHRSSHLTPEVSVPTFCHCKALPLLIFTICHGSCFKLPILLTLW